ncbi:DUF4855 domain-containing protein [Paenibacillus dokdonensis]|uniref:DUF4855 domain-containing protein n=1 Tax=Paenibacillus dokdonensis TaxID=2567944 RepID=UPI0010A94375|nr:DUF4855 domain-containing protein [Paenibacillus dokdonensis]
MRLDKRWGAIVMSVVLLLTWVPAAQAKELIPTIQIIQTGDPDPAAGTEIKEPAEATQEPEAETEPPAAKPEEPEEPVVETEEPPAQTEESPMLAEAGLPELRNLASGLHYDWSEEPESAHPDDGNKLTDGIYGELNMSDPAWVGQLHKKTREVVFDLGEKKSVANIKAHFLQDYPTNSILVPLTVSMYVSDDKENWGLLSNNATQLLWGDGPPRDETFEWKGSRDGIKSGNLNAQMAYARYVKVTFSMHPTNWCFIDEIEIWGTDGEVDGAVSVPTEQPGFLQPGAATADIHNLGLLYNGQYANDKGTWTKERIIPNISYVDQSGKPADWLFDGILYLGITSPSGHDYGGNANLEDWKWYLDKTFAETGDMQQLNEATKEVGAELNQPNHKEKVVLMIPDPGESINDFGDVDGDGVSESFNNSAVGKEKALANREKAVQWWLSEVEKRWGEENYSNLELVGMYWLEEQISTSETGPDLLRSVSAKVHDMNLKFFWIPHFLAYKSYMWKDVGFDAVAFQPNYFFEEMGYDRLEDAANIAKQYGMSNELEFDDRMLTDGVFRERYIDYLNSGVETGLMQNGFKAYYQGNNAVYDSAVSTDAATRIMYDWLYQFVNGTYQINNAAPPEAVVHMNGQTLQTGATVPDTEPVQFAWEVKNDDGSGLTKVTATFDGKAYAAGTVIDLAGKPGKHELIITVAAGKSQKTSYVIEASTSAEGMKTLVNRFEEKKQFKNAEAARSLNNYLEMMKRFEGVDQAQVVTYLKGFNAKLDLMNKDQMISDEAYNTLKEEVYYLAGNLAQNKAVEASSVEGSNPNYAPGKAVDGFPATRWASDYKDNTWYQIDLGEVKEMDSVRIDWEYARAKTYRLLVSDDKQNWTSVVKDHDGVITARDGKETVHFDPIKARYMKFQGIERATDYGYSFYEFGIYNLSGGGDVKNIEGMKAVIDAASKKVTIDGLVMNGELAKVNLQVLDPRGKIQRAAQTTSSEAGSFHFEFTLTGDVEGTYVANLSTDDMSMPVKVTFEYKRVPAGGDGNGGNTGNTGNTGNSGGGGGNSGASNIPAAPGSEGFQLQKDGSVKAVFSSKLDTDGKTAVSTLSEQDMRMALALAKSDPDGKLKVTLELKKYGDAAKYAVDLPAAFLSGYPHLILEIITPKASVQLSGELFAQSTGIGKQLRLVISELERQSLNQAAQALKGSRPIIGLEIMAGGKSIPWKNEKTPMTVTIPYLPAAGQEDMARIGVLSMNEQGIVSKMQRTTYSESGNYIRFQTDHTGVYAVFYEQPASQFTDLDRHVWAKEAVEKLAALGIVKGTSAGTFSPAEQVSRADFILMLVRALDLKAAGADVFTDVKPQDYYYEAVAAAKQLGIVTGTDGGRFEPSAKITRQDMMVMAARAVQAWKTAEIDENLAELDGYEDANQVSAYAKGSVAGMIKQGLIQGDHGLIHPAHNTTRAETAVFLYRLLNYLSE